MNKLPRVLKGFNAFINGDNQHGVLVEITRPKIARKTEDYTPGGDKQGEGGEHKFKIALTYWKETLDGEDVVEIDMRNNVAKFGGKDERAGLRAALGI